MPPKKPFRRDNKKKKGKKDLIPSAENAASLSAFANLVDDWNDAGINSNGRKISSSSAPHYDRTGGRGLYGIYKQATQRFKDGLMALVPAEIFARDRVQTIMDAVDYLVSQEHKIDPLLLNDCRVSLQFRQSYSKQFEDGGDEGHAYFILVLNYCFQTLKPLVPHIKRRKAKEGEKRFSFTDLDMESDGEEEQDEADNGDDDRPAPPVRPPEPEDEFTIHDLVESTDSCQACLFLFNVEKCMNVVATNYAGLKKKACYLRANGIRDPSCLIGTLMTCAAATNFSIRQVQLMEEELKVNLPHLSSFYRVMACVSFKPSIEQLETLLKKLGKRIPRIEVTAFVGDIVEQAFRLPDAVMASLDVVVKEFCRQWSLPFDEVKDLATGVLTHALVESRRSVAQNFADLYPEMVPSYQWMNSVQYIGGDRSILNTQALIQQTAKLFETYPPILFVSPGIFGTLWDEQKCPATKIKGDMDQLLREIILPELLYSCMIGSLHHDIPRVDELLPLVKMLKDYIKNPTKPVPLSLTFGIHAILTAIFELQGDGDVASIAKAAKHSYRIYFEQLEALLVHPDFGTYGVWKHDIDHIIRYQGLACPIDKNEKRAACGYWNPCLAGMFLTYITLNNNVGGGAAVMNRLEQLRMILHLCNAFQQRDLLGEEIPLLTALDKYFKSVQYLWGGDKPARESIVKKFWLSYGLKADVMRDIHEDCRRFVMHKEKSNLEDFLETRNRVQPRGGGRRDWADCHPYELSQAFCKICLGDFGKITESDNSALDVGKDDSEWNMQYARFLNDTVATMNHEEELISWNFVTLGCCLSGFMRFLSGKLGWDEPVEEKVSQMGQRDTERRRIRRGNNNVKAETPEALITYKAHAHSVVLSKWYVNHILGPLEFLDDPGNDPVVVAARDCLVEYFSTLDSSRYKIFNVLAEADEKGWKKEDTQNDSL